MCPEGKVPNQKPHSTASPGAISWQAELPFSSRYHPSVWTKYSKGGEQVQGPTSLFSERCHLLAARQCGSLQLPGNSVQGSISNHPRQWGRQGPHLVTGLPSLLGSLSAAVSG